VETILLLIFILLGVVISCIFLLSSLLLYPPRQPLTRNPSDYNLPYEEVTFFSTDHMTLKGWWIPYGSSAPAIILLHPMFGNRHGLEIRRKPWPALFRTEVDLLKVAQAFHRAGWAVLLFDFRSHGESPRGLCGGGLTEDQDVIGAVDYTFNRMASSLQSEATPQVGVVGFGLGALAVMTAIGRIKGKAEKMLVFTGDMEGGAGWTEIQPPNIKRIRFVISIQPGSPGSLLLGCLKDLTPLLSVFVPLVDRLCRARGGYPLTGDQIIKAAREIYLPVLFVQSRIDPWAASSELQSVYEALPGPKHLEWVEGHSDPLDACRFLANNPHKLLEFAAQFKF
jgi:uncharacterized protein